MLSFLLPENINVFFIPGFFKIEGPYGNFIKKTGSLQFNIITTSEGSRLFITGASFKESSTALSYIFQLVQGLSQGFRRRLRLVGIGFRATTRQLDTTFPYQLESLHTKNYRRKRLSPKFGVSPENRRQDTLNLKIGYSHEVSYPISGISGRSVSASRLEGRSKGTLIALKSNSLSKTHQVASEIRSFRTPDAYKGKGIYYDREVVKLKKGKRQG